ncbi:hypothetical protein GE061_019293 [Apolygus lucorum]|uniref:Uncharacterized protein n=1 Tax=Apolygus lucorum TaxID=248454 RepID=A0A8S9XAP1_APOLU|nr:hypothetical protein GE061_019293 [Apolygus lucorum]
MSLLVSPTPCNTPKKRGRTSPEESPNKREPKKKFEMVGKEMTYDNLMAGFKGMLEREIGKVRADINGLTGTVESLVNAARDTENEVKVLRSENENLRKHVMSIEERIRQNNIVITGFENTEENLKDGLMKLFTEILGVGDPLDVTQVFRLGKGPTNPILVTMATTSMVYLVLSKTKALKNAGIYISRDMHPGQRNRVNKTLKLRWEIRKICPSLQMKMFRDILEIGNQKYEWSSKGLVCGELDGAEELKKIVGKDMKL